MEFRGKDVPEFGFVRKFGVDFVVVPDSHLLSRGGGAVGDGVEEGFTKVHLPGTFFPARKGEVAEDDAFEGGNAAVKTRDYPVG